MNAALKRRLVALESTRGMAAAPDIEVIWVDGPPVVYFDTPLPTPVSVESRPRPKIIELDAGETLHDVMRELNCSETELHRRMKAGLVQIRST